MSNYESLNHKKIKVIQSLLFCLILLIGGILFFILKKDKISIEEKRKLSQFPSFTLDKLINSEYTDSIDLYYSDNFIYRNDLIYFANTIKSNNGFKYNDIEYFSDNNNYIKNKTIKTPSKIIDTGFKNVDVPYENFNSVIIANKRALQLFSGSKISAQKMAKLIKQYKSEFHDSINIISMVAPIGGDFYLPLKLNHRKEKEFIDYFYSLIDTDVICVRAYEEISQHLNEYIYFNTDHHWTGLGAYYAYTSFCKAINLVPLSLAQMNRRVIPNFLGTLYYHTRASILKENTDSVVYYKIPTKTEVTYYRDGITKAYKCSLYAEYAKGGNSYGVYLGSDYPLMRIKSEIKNKKKIAIFKDSYGNPFSTYLPSHYEEVFVIDYRYFNGSIKELIKTYKITDIMFCHNAYVFNSDFTIAQEKSFLNHN